MPTEADGDGRRRRHRSGGIGVHHDAFELRSRAVVETLQAFLGREKMAVVEPAEKITTAATLVFFHDLTG